MKVKLLLFHQEKKIKEEEDLVIAYNIHSYLIISLIYISNIFYSQKDYFPQDQMYN